MYPIGTQVLHGCLQIVPLRRMVYSVNDRNPGWYFIVLLCVGQRCIYGAKTSLNDPYGWGYRRAARDSTMCSNLVKGSESPTLFQYRL